MEAVEDAGRLVELAEVEGRFGPAAAAADVESGLVVVVFLSEMEEEVVVEVVGRLVSPAAEPAAAELVGRVLAAALGFVGPAAGCKAGPKT